MGEGELGEGRSTWAEAGWGEGVGGCGVRRSVCVCYLGLELNGMVNHSGSFDAHDINHHR